MSLADSVHSLMCLSRLRQKLVHTYQFSAHSNYIFTEFKTFVTNGNHFLTGIYLHLPLTFGPSNLIWWQQWVYLYWSDLVLMITSQPSPCSRKKWHKARSRERELTEERQKQDEEFYLREKQLRLEMTRLQEAAARREESQWQLDVLKSFITELHKQLSEEGIVGQKMSWSQNWLQRATSKPTSPRLSMWWWLMRSQSLVGRIACATVGGQSSAGIFCNVSRQSRRKQQGEGCSASPWS